MTQPTCHTLRDLELADRFGQIDIYLFDQQLRGRIVPGMKVFDAGCGAGRNLVYLMREGYDVYGADTNPAAIAAIRQLAAALAPHSRRTTSAPSRSIACRSRRPLPDVVLSSAVLHFAESDADFDAMLQGTWRMLKPGGLFFCRLASLTGIDSSTPAARPRPLPSPRRQRPLSDRRRAPPRSHPSPQRHILDPIETTVVHAQRAMTTWVVGSASTWKTVVACADKSICLTVMTVAPVAPLVQTASSAAGGGGEDGVGRGLVRGEGGAAPPKVTGRPDDDTGGARGRRPCAGRRGFLSQATMRRPRSSVAICGCDGLGLPSVGMQDARREGATVGGVSVDSAPCGSFAPAPITEAR